MFREGCFVDWCPTNAAFNAAGKELVCGDLSVAKRNRILNYGKPVVKSVSYVARADGIFAFKMEVDRLYIARELRRLAMYVAREIKSELKHDHCYDRVRQLGDELHKPIQCWFKSSSPPDLKAILADDLSILKLYAASRDGQSATQTPACVLLREEHARARIRFTRTHNSGVSHESSRSFYKHQITEASLLLFVAAIVVFATTTYYLNLSFVNSLAMFIFMLVCVLLANYFRYIVKKVQPRRQKLWYLVGYLNTCSIYSDILDSLIIKNSQDEEVKKLVGPSDPFRKIEACLLPALHIDHEKYVIRLGLMAMIMAAIGVFAALLAIYSSVVP